MRSFLKWFVVFLVINFGGLALGTILMANGPQSDWYVNLKQAPWTPPGWLFGVAWTVIMLCFSAYMAIAIRLEKGSAIKWFFTAQVVLNIGWNYVFFNQHLIVVGFIWIVMLTLLILGFLLRFKLDGYRHMRWLLAPYIIWLLIASSLNGYIAWYN